MQLRPTLFALIFLVLSGCTSSKMRVASQQELSPAPPGKAQIVFLRSSFVGGDIQSPVYDVTSGNPFFIGIVANNTKVRHLTDPGRRIFMVVSQAADFMQAELVAGRTYYAIVTPNAGEEEGRFSLHPIRKDPASAFSTASPDFAVWLANTRLVDNTPESEKWARDNNRNIGEKYHDSWPTWLGKNPEEKKQLTLRPDDGE